MKTRYTVVLSMIAGAAVGAAAIQGLHAQTKRVYMISESEIVGDRGALDAYNAQVQKALKDAGGTLVISDNVTKSAGQGFAARRRYRIRQRGES